MTIKLRDRNVNIATPRPNWSSPVGVEYSFKTSIITSRDGTEQRAAERQRPRIALSYTTAMTQALIARHHADMVVNQDALWSVRAEWAWVRLSADAVAPTSAIEVDRVPDWMFAGQAVILETDGNEDWYEISSVSGTTITLGEISAVDYPAGTKVYLAYWSRAAASSDFTAQTSHLWTGAVRYEVNPGEGEPPSTTPYAFTFGGARMFLKKPNWRTGPKITFLQERDVFDPGVGLIDTNAPWAANVTKLSYGFTGLTLEDSEELVAFFNYVKGRRSAFWVPDWNKTVLVDDEQIGSAKVIKIAGEDFRNAYSGDPTYQSMIAFFPDCTFQANTITSIDGTTDSEVKFENAWSQEINSSTRIYWLVRARFESDTLNVSWVTNEAAEVTYAMRTLPHDKTTPWPLPASTEAMIPADNHALAYGDMPVYGATPTRMSNVIDLLGLGFSEEFIDSEQVMALCQLTGMYQEGTPLADDDTTFFLNIVFHDEEPVNWYDHTVPALPGDVTDIDELQGPLVDISLSAVTVPATTRFVQFRVSYHTAVTSWLQVTDSKWVITAPDIGSFVGTSMC